MASDPRIRASAADRDRVAEALREHHAAGRLSIEEFEERLDRVYAAKTLGDLDGLVADLPAIDLYQLPIPASARPVPARPPAHPVGRLSPVWQAAWAAWASVTVLCVVIWLLSGVGYFWPIWVAAPWGAVMGVRWLLGVSPGDHHGGRGEIRAQHRDFRAEVRNQRAQFRQDLRSSRRDRRTGLPWDPPGTRRGDGSLPWDPPGGSGEKHGGD